MHSLPTLRLFFGRGVANDYRLREHCVEFRTNEGPWRILSEEDIQLHYVLHTEVAKWLMRESENAHRTGRSKKQLNGTLDASPSSFGLMRH